MRLHALTLSYLAGTPAFGIDGDGRIAAFAKECGIPCRTVEECGDIAAALEEALTAETPDAAIWNERLAAGRAACPRASRAGKGERKMIYTDQHIHCQCSPDSHTPLREMAAAARDHGMSAVCFTDHIDMDFGNLGDLRWEARKDILRAAWADVRANPVEGHHRPLRH